jgi:hypothetical protein
MSFEGLRTTSVAHPHHALKMLSSADSVIIAGFCERYFVKKDAQYAELL